jgi:hypothetical protein
MLTSCNKHVIPPGFVGVVGSLITGIDMPGYKHINPIGFSIRPKPLCLKNTPFVFLIQGTRYNLKSASLCLKKVPSMNLIPLGGGERGIIRSEITF